MKNKKARAGIIAGVVVVALLALASALRLLSLPDTPVLW